MRATPTRVTLSAADRSAVNAFLAKADAAADVTAAHPAPPQRKTPPASGPPPAEVASELRRLSAQPSHAATSAARGDLPARQHREALLGTIRGHGVTLVRGATGCGKSTQLPSMLLEEATERGERVNIVVSQPRRLAAIALADRVAAELGDDGGAGGLCGYRIRGDSKVCSSTALTFMTVGVLLRQCEADPSLAGYTHVVVDEVHERSVDTDLLLLSLHRMLRAATAAGVAAPRVVLMSATVQTCSFVDYFGGVCGSGVGVCDVPGRSFPVREVYLEQAIAECGYRCDPRGACARYPPLPLGSLAS